MQFSFWFSRLFPLPFILVGGLVLWIGGQNLYNGKSSETWPQVSGQIMESSVTSSKGSGSQRTYRAAVRYRFRVKDKAYIGDRITYKGNDSGGSSVAEALVKRYPQGKLVTVYYKPDNPSQSVLEPGLTLDAFWVPGIGFLFFGVGCVMAVMLPKMMQDV
ncbi:MULTISPECIES: DUF3592 domain-containing protein [Calothrix]|uniref:DUF3592 domain-containing protein n=2 Tax=Calothrix TaxID=1186 RepID=A0ABR8AKY3_9CYAN|nr:MULTISPECIES: DUF3592 domain-containing protein [Calothrix]MBD2199943.1 DUF3592 domain-containing protein [Calothrix parietina FACHB-288]MBD2228890.1 DUF3592 domain-containing protein [Calothrix anomala FACHB-343]